MALCFAFYLVMATISYVSWLGMIALPYLLAIPPLYLAVKMTKEDHRAKWKKPVTWSLGVEVLLGAILWACKPTHDFAERSLHPDDYKTFDQLTEDLTKKRLTEALQKYNGLAADNPIKEPATRAVEAALPTLLLTSNELARNGKLDQAIKLVSSVPKTFKGASTRERLLTSWKEARSHHQQVEARRAAANMALVAARLSKAMGVAFPSVNPTSCRFESRDGFVTIEAIAQGDSDVRLTLRTHMDFINDDPAVYNNFVGEFGGQRTIGKFLLNFPNSDYNHMTLDWWMRKKPGFAQVSRFTHVFFGSAAGTTHEQRLLWWSELLRGSFTDVLARQNVGTDMGPRSVDGKIGNWGYDFDDMTFFMSTTVSLKEFKRVV